MKSATRGAVGAVCTYLALSLMEELGFRGYALRRLHSAFGVSVAVLVSAFAFALTHVAFGWPWFAIVAGVIPGGLLFGMAAGQVCERS